MFTALSARLPFICYSILLFFAIIISRLAYLQITLNPVLYYKAQKNFKRFEKTPSIRGNIFDCNNRLLATNLPIITLYWQGTGNKKLTLQQQKLISDLQAPLEKSFPDNALIEHAEYRLKKLLLATDLTLQQLCQITESFPDNKNIYLTTTFKRFYPFGSVASHIIGYLGSINTDQKGKMGLERLFEDDLRGTQGQICTTINSYGKQLENTELEQAHAGKHLYTTIDLSLQQIAESLIAQDQAGVIILMESKTGALRTLVSRPAFDPNIFLKPITYTDWAQLQHHQPFVDRIFCGLYPPASLVKLITLSLALEEKIIEPDTEWDCKGFVTCGKRRYHCSHRYGHGILTTQQAVAKSCNIPFFEIGKKIKIDQLADYAKRFGLGAKTGVLFPEKAGLVPTTQWKWLTYNEPWWPGDTLSASIGQGPFCVTPIQMCCMISSLCEGFFVTPRILQDEPVIQRPLEISQETQEFIKLCMHATGQIGTAQQLRRLDNLTMYIKTGTGQVSNYANRHKGPEHAEHGWFVGNFTYKNEPSLTLVIILEHVGTARVSTSLAKQFLLRYCKLVDNKLTVQ